MTIKELTEIKGPFGGEITEKGLEAAMAIREKFGGQQRVTTDEMTAFLRDELQVEHPGLYIIFGGGDEIMIQGLGFDHLIDDWQDKDGVRRHGWCGWIRREEVR
jgi:hypothetical protein